ncbi:MAG: helix-turn-helix domain-containing protein [Dehalococcoidia bacterium]|nr:helix-turn-helix domain-containing protein [Dehalococcoidia bacterium]MDW8119063.1 helix-turn-helix domain-containing protein [Chloroflexota bacterium]
MAALPDTFSVPQAARLLGVSPEHLRRALREGTLVGTKKGGQWVVSRQALEAWAKAQGLKMPPP